MTRKQLLAEAEAWRKIGRRIERQPNAYFWAYMDDRMQDRAKYHLGLGQYHIDEGSTRAIAAYWLALECEDEARRARR